MSVSRKLKRRLDAQSGRGRIKGKVLKNLRRVDSFLDKDFQDKLDAAVRDLDPRIIGVAHREGMSYESNLRVIRDILEMRKTNEVLAVAPDPAQENLMRDIIRDMEEDIKKVLAVFPKKETP